MANNKLYTELTFFSTQITNLLVARRTAEDQYIGINAVSSHWDGISELSTVTNESIPTIKLFFGCGQSLHI
jgi:iron complex outermembrane receptor protein